MGTSNDLKHGVLNAIFNSAAYEVAALTVSLHQSDPGTTGASEVTGGTYARQAVPLVAAASGAYESDTDIEFTGMPDTTADDIEYVGLWAGSTFLTSAALSVAKVTNAGDIFRIPTGDLDWVVT